MFNNLLSFWKGKDFLSSVLKEFETMLIDSEEMFKAVCAKLIEGKETAISAGDVMFIPAGEKHQTINRSGQDLRYLEFFTCPPVTADFVSLED